MVSVIIPVFNTKPYLVRCLDSVVNQTFSDLEIILIDDGSTDGSSEVCDEYALVDSRIKVIHKRNEGLVRARKDGICNSTGQFIAYVDSDDWIETNMIEHMYSYLVEENVDIVMCGRYEDTGNISREVFQGIAEGRYDKNGLLKYVYPNMIVNGAFFEWGVFPGVWDKLFRRNCLEKYQMLVDDRITMGEDAACTYPCLLNANSIYILHECLYHYRQTGASMVKQVQNFEVQRMRFSILYNSVYELFEKYRYIYDLRQQWKEYVLFLMVPRADILYKNVENLEYLFPFKKVKKGSNIIIYGMGTYGQILYKFIKRTRFCNLIACVDQNYKVLSEQGLPVISADEIRYFNYDAIIIANSFAKAREEIYKELRGKYPRGKIHIIDEKLIKSEMTLQAFDLIK